ncbi:unnamed protein product [Schistosoma margrebowiei]|uniref:Uncharacterized protein n=1 Tax=Schistosoma margrebowiei TaxID=48269 RepID=A0A183NCB0_9TREM|nr:unnamed protein product [Schistosoma margrebowiei]
MMVGGSQQDPSFVLFGSCNLEGTDVPWWIRSSVTQLHSHLN